MLEPLIGVVGGVGPYAGLDLLKKIFDQTRASTDQEHLNVVLCSFPGDVPDRTQFVLYGGVANPAIGIYQTIRKLERMGCTVIGIPCNTAHSPSILDEVSRRLKENGSPLLVLNMVEETGRFISQLFPAAHRVGILATDGTVSTDVYGTIFRRLGFTVIYPDSDYQNSRVHRAIYDREFGIKATGDRIDRRVRPLLDSTLDHLVLKGSEVIVLACTELPLAFDKHQYDQIPLIDSTLVLARSLIDVVAPQRLRPLQLLKVGESSI